MQALLGVVFAAFVAAPLVLAVINDYQARAFQRQAFGHFARAAFYIRLMVWVVFLYYVAVLATSFQAEELQHALEWPLPATGLVIYVRIGAAILSYSLMLLVTKELYLVTQPRKGSPLPGAQ